MDKKRTWQQSKEVTTMTKESYARPRSLCRARAWAAFGASIYQVLTMFSPTLDRRAMAERGGRRGGQQEQRRPLGSTVKRDGSTVIAGAFVLALCMKHRWRLVLLVDG